MNRNIRSLVNDSPMSRFQVLAIAICFLINMLDGFDVLVMAFTAHSISEEWELGGKSLGILFSSGLVGMALGAMFLGQQADTWGRRRLIVVCLVIITTGMFMSSLTGSLHQLAILRVFTGLGIGGALASLNSITAEYSSNNRRGISISLVHIGYPLGGIVGGAMAGVLIPESGWRSVFVLGALLSAMMIPVVLWRLPESMDYLLARRPADALERINLLLHRMGHEQVSTLPDEDSSTPTVKPDLRGLWQVEYRGATMLMWLSFFMAMASIYFVLSWTPKLLVLAGLSEGQGISGGMLLQIGGISGQFLFGLLSTRFKLKKLTAINMLLAALCMVFFAIYSSDLGLAMYLSVCVGFFLFGSITGLYILGPVLYQAEIRSTGIGWGIGVGRIGAILSPFITGVLLDLGWETSSLYFAFTVPMLLAMMAIVFINTHNPQK